MSGIRFGICGDFDWHNTSEEDNPFSTLEKNKVKDLISELNRDPMDEGELFSKYGEIKEEIEKLLRLKTLKKRGEKIYVNFTFIDKEDSEFLMEVCEDHALKLVDLISSKKGQIHEVLSRYENKRVGKDKLAFFIIGCYFLDWGTLKLFSKWGIADNMKPQPGGNEYVLWGEENYENILKEIYWGGHMIPDIDYVFHTFGDHHKDTKRNTFPDILHRFNDFDFPGGAEYRSLLFEKRKGFASELADIIVIIGKEGASKDLLEKKLEYKSLDKRITLLQKLGYIDEEDDRYYLSVPFFTEEDRDMILDCIRPLIPILKDWIDDDLEDLKSDIEPIRPSQNGVPFDEYFIQVWHYIFGLVNKNLANRSIIYDTYSDDSEHKGYMPGITIKDVLLELEELI